MAAKKKGQLDVSKFEGNGISFKAKLIGVEEVPEARGDLLCQETITKLKSSVKTSGQHKQKIFINVTLEGLKVIDALSMIVLHTHPVHRISFISRDTTDNRAFGYIIGSGDGKHTFFAIKTAAAAEQLVLTLRDLFQVVYEMKKKQVDEAKEKLDTAKEDTEEGENPSGDGLISGEGQTQTQPPADADGVYHVPPNNAPVNGSIEEQQANLLDLEDQADSILKGIEQIKNLEFDSLGEDEKSSTPVSPQPFKSGTADPWAAPASNPNAQPSSNLGDLAGIQTGPFVNMQQPFPGQVAGFNTPAFNMINSGLPVTQNPFGTDPFAGSFQPQPGMRPAAFGAAPAAANPFGSAPFAQPFQSGMVRQPVVGGMFPVNANPNPFANNARPQDDPSLLKPIKPEQGLEAPQDPANTRSKSPRVDPFEDLVGIKKSTNNAQTPKDMFAQLSASEKKSMNELKQVSDGPPKSAF